MCVPVLSTCYDLCFPLLLFLIHWTLFFVLLSCSCCFPPHFFFCILLLTGKLIVNVPCFIPVTVLLLRVHMYFVSLERDRTLLYRVLDDGLHQATLDPNLHISVPKLLLFFISEGWTIFINLLSCINSIHRFAQQYITCCISLSFNPHS